jgi:transposase
MSSAKKLGRPSLAPGMYFRVMLIGFFEGIESERGITRRVADSLCLRRFLQIGLDERTPDHVTISRTRRLMDEATHQEVFGWVLRQVARAGLLKGKTIGIDATTLEANAAMKSIVRRDTEESYTEYLKRLAESAGLEATDEAALRRRDRRRKKKGSNEEWVNPHDPEAEITRLKDGRTALAYKAEHAVDMDTGAIVAVTTHGGAVGDTTSVGETLPAAGGAVAEQIRRADIGWQVRGEREWRGGDGQGLPLRGCAGLSTAIGGAVLHRCTRSRAAEVSGQTCRAGGRLRQPATARWLSRQAVAEEAGRTGRAHVRASLRDGCSAAIVRAWKGRMCRRGCCYRRLHAI